MTLNDISLNNKPATFTTARHIKVQPVEIALAECEILPPHHLPDGAAAYARLFGLRQNRPDHARRVARLGTGSRAVAPDVGGRYGAGQPADGALLNRTLRIVLWAKNDDRPVIKVLQPESLRLGGVGDEEALLPTAVGNCPATG